MGRVFLAAVTKAVIGVTGVNGTRSEETNEIVDVRTRGFTEPADTRKPRPWMGEEVPSAVDRGGVVDAVELYAAEFSGGDSMPVSLRMTSSHELKMGNTCPYIVDSGGDPVLISVYCLSV